MDASQPGMRIGKKRAWPEVFLELLERVFSASNGATAGAPHVRHHTNTGRLLLFFILATLPVLLFGLWNLGSKTLQTMAQKHVSDLPDWQWDLFAAIGFDATSHGAIAPFLLGLAYFLPLLVVSLITGVFWTVLFATVRRRRVDPGWLMACWLFALLLPATLPLGLAVLGISFGLVFGKHIFGGTGRYIVSPALLGVLFLQFSYPGYFAGAASFLPIPDLVAGTTWATVVTHGLSEAEAAGLNWSQAFLGLEIGAIGAGSTLLCLAGTTILIYSGAASARTIVGAFIGLIIATVLVNTLGAGEPHLQLPWYWHIALGNFAFGVAFIATDPTPTPMTAQGRWTHGIMIGVLTILIRVFNPAHPDGTLYAILLAALATPVIDYFVIRIRVARWQRRWKKADG